MTPSLLLPPPVIGGSKRLTASPIHTDTTSTPSVAQQDSLWFHHRCFPYGYLPPPRLADLVAILPATTAGPIARPELLSKLVGTPTPNLKTLTSKLEWWRIGSTSKNDEEASGRAGERALPLRRRKK